MSVDVTTQITIDLPRADVAAYAGDPDKAPEWYVNIKRARWESERPLRVGSRVAFVARFLGRAIEYTYEFTEVRPGERIVMRTAQGPFPMETTYVWESAGPHATRMTLRNRGEPGGFGNLAAPLIARAMRRANQNDLARLKGILEGRITRS